MHSLFRQALVLLLSLSIAISNTYSLNYFDNLIGYKNNTTAESTFEDNHDIIDIAEGSHVGLEPVFADVVAETQATEPAQEEAPADEVSNDETPVAEEKEPMIENGGVAEEQTDNTDADKASDFDDKENNTGTEAPDKKLIFSDDNYDVTAIFDAAASLADNAALDVVKIEGEDFEKDFGTLANWFAEKQQKKAEAEAANSEQPVEGAYTVVSPREYIGKAEIFDMNILLGGEKTALPSEAEFEFTFTSAEFAGKTNLALFRYAENGLTRVDADITANEDGKVTATFKADEIGKYAVAAVETAKPMSMRAAAPMRGPGTIQTADSRADGITMHLFDFWGEGSGKNLNQGGNVPTETTNYWGTTYNWYVPNDYKIGINKKLNTNDFNRLLFTAYGKTPGDTLNHFTGENAHAREGIVTKRLPGNGYPQLTNNSTLQTNGESLKYLFDLNNIPNAKKVYRNVNHLMTLDDQGTYRFNSNTNYAYYNSTGDNGNFKVYNGTYKTSNNSSYAIGFFPFNDYDDGYKNINNMEDTHYNHHFGMTMSAAFSLPTDGKLPNGQDMVFEYSGDDDMWLYIDNVLVLDIGGIHEPVQGTINFATGVVKTWPQNDPGNVRQTTLQALFQAQGLTWKNDTSHKFNMFYLERGGQYSNLALTLNIPIVKTVTVNKAVEGIFDEEYMNRDFQFLALVNKGDGNYVPYQGNIEKRSVTTYVSDGRFTLKPTESAKLLDMKTSWKYKIVELGLNGSEFGEVEIEGSGAATHILSDGQTGLEASSGMVNTGTDQNNNLTFKNKIREEKGSVIVEKIWEGDNGNHGVNEIKFKLYRIKNGDAANKVLYQDENGNTVFRLNLGTQWKKTFQNLIKKSGSDIYTYEVEETEVPSGYVVEYSYTENEQHVGIFKITNKKRTKVIVKKEWYEKDGTPLTSDLPNEVTVQLYQYKMAKVPQVVPGTGSDEKVKVVFRSKYYGWNQVQPPNYIYDVGHYADSNPHPYDNGGYLKPDSFNEEMVQYVTKGGSITFTIKTRDTDLGVYEVYDRRTNEKLNAANPDDTSIRMEWLGKNKAYNWEGRHPMRVRGTYTLSNLTQNVVHVDVEMIGYLKYGPNGSNEWVPSLRDSFDYINIQTTEPSGGTTTIYVPPTPPTEMPALGTPGLSPYGGPKEIKPETNWQHIFDDLPVMSNDGQYYYFYYVKEEPAIPGFKVTYEGNGSSGGNITVKNTRETIDIPVEKTWSDQSTNSHSGTTVTVKLLKQVGEEWVDTTKRVTLTSSGDWKGKFEKLPKYDAGGNIIQYKIEEIPVSGYISTITAQTIDGISGYEIYNQLLRIEILKTDALDDEALPNAKFSLYSDEACNNIVGAFTDANLTPPAATVFETDSNGKVSVYGLNAGTYYLKEVQAPHGYILIRDPIKLTVSNEGVVTLGEPYTFASVTNQGTGVVQITVTNRKPEYPDTGWNGGYMYLTLGLSLMLMALTIRYRRRLKRAGY